MNIKMPKRNRIDMLKIAVRKAWIATFGKSVTTIKGQKIRAVIICAIAITIIIALIVLISNISKADTFSSPDNTKAKYLNEKNSSKVKMVYNSNEKKDQFIALAKDIELRIVNYYINTITKTNSQESVINNLNRQLEKREWTSIDMREPQEWIGSWSVDKTGALKFKFLNEKMEPNWINDKDVTKYIVKN